MAAAARRAKTHARFDWGFLVRRLLTLALDG